MSTARDYSIATVTVDAASQRTPAVPAVVIFSDFDGTISTTDTGVVLIDHCMGTAARQALDLQILNGTMSFREAIAKMWQAVDMTLPDALGLLNDVRLDDKFPAFLADCQAHGWPVCVVSSGLDFLVRHFLEQSLGVSLGGTDETSTGKATVTGPGALKMIANRGKVTDGRRWVIEFVDESVHGHDKANSIKQYLETHVAGYTFQPRQPEMHLSTNGTSTAPLPRPLVVFIGDGVSDISCVGACDVLFAKRGKHLEEYCTTHGIPYFPFDDFGQVQQQLQALLRQYRVSQ
ncbi:hypothetical protein RI367_007175 [Sorochytrium milnesiophthora]